MTFKRTSGGASIDLTTSANRRESGTWKPIDLVRRRSGGAWTIAWQRINLSDLAAFSTTFIGTATARYNVKSDGTIFGTSGNNTTSQLGTWLTFGTASNYEVRATVVSGTLSSGTTGSWLDLASDREWTVAQVTVGINTAVITVEIRNASTLVVVDSATIEIEAERG